jgi:plastocyanin
VNHLRYPHSGKRLALTATKIAAIAVAVGLVAGAGAAPAIAQYDPCDFNTEPSPSFVYDPVPARPGQPVTFTSTSTDADGDQLIEVWDFNNDGQFDAQGDKATHTFAAPGDYPVHVEVTDGCGGFVRATRVVRVEAPTPPPPPPGQQDTTGPEVISTLANKVIAANPFGFFIFTLGPFREEVTGTVGVESVSAVIGSRRRRLVLAARPFSAPSGRRVRVRFRIPRKGLRVLRRRKRMRMRARVVARDRLGNATRRNFVFTLRAPRKKR